MQKQKRITALIITAADRLISFSQEASKLYIILFGLSVKKLKFREVKTPIQAHTVCKGGRDTVSLRSSDYNADVCRSD